MSSSLDPLTTKCPHCGAILTQQDKCWLCGRASSPSSIAPVLKHSQRAPFQFGMDSILLLMTFAAVVSGLFAIAPGVAVVGLVLCLPALIRTTIVAHKHRASGSPMAWNEKALAFLATTAFVIVLLVAMGIAFYATCWVGFWAGAFGHSFIDQSAGFGTIGTGLIVGIALGIVAALAVMWWMVRRAVKKDYHVPTWVGWFGLIVALVGLLLFVFFCSSDAESMTFFLATSAFGLIFSLVGLASGLMKPCLWGISLGFGPIVVWLIGASVYWGFFDTLTAPLVTIAVSLVSAVGFHVLWLLQRDTNP